MPKMYIAFHQQGARIASGSMTTLRKRVSEFPESQWNVFQYDFKSGVETLALIIEGDVQKWGTPKPIESWRVNAQKQVRKFDPTKDQVP